MGLTIDQTGLVGYNTDIFISYYFDVMTPLGCSRNNIILSLSDLTRSQKKKK